MNIDASNTDQEIEKYYDLQRRALIDKDIAALSELYQGNLRVVMKLAQRYENQGASYNDLVIAGFQGFCEFMAKATAKDAAGTGDFSTLSTLAIRGAMTKIVTPPEQGSSPESSFVEE